MPTSKHRNSKRSGSRRGLRRCCTAGQHDIVASPATENRPIPKANLSALNRGRKKLWEIPDHFHCSVVGTCLRLDELRYLARRAKLPVNGEQSDYELHHMFVALVQESGPVAKLVHKHLDRKYKRFVHRFIAVDGDEDALATQWEDAVASGDVAGPYWALLTHPGLTNALLDKAYGEIHMMSHLAGASCRADMQELIVLRVRARQLEKELAEVQATVHRKTAEHNETIRELQESSSKLVRVEEELRETKAKLGAFERHEVFGELQIQLEQQARLLTEARIHAERAEANAEKWQQFAQETSVQCLHEQGCMAELQSERDALEEALEKLLTPDCNTCENRDIPVANEISV